MIREPPYVGCYFLTAFQDWCKNNFIGRLFVGSCSWRVSLNFGNASQAKQSGTRKSDGLS